MGLRRNLKDVDFVQVLQTDTDGHNDEWWDMPARGYQEKNIKFKKKDNTKDDVKFDEEKRIVNRGVEN